MSGTTPLLPAYAFMSWTATSVPLLRRSDRTRGTKRSTITYVSEEFPQTATKTDTSIGSNQVRQYTVTT